MQILQQLSQSLPVSYAESAPAHSIELWLLLIAACVLLIEWLASRR